MSEAAAAERSPDSTSIRRWPHYKVNVPIRVIALRRGVSSRGQLAKTERGSTPYAAD